MASFAAATMALGGITLAAPSNAAPESSHIVGQIMVNFRHNAAAPDVLRQHGLSDGGCIGSTGARLIKVPAGKELQLVTALSRNPAMEYAEPDQLVTAATDDPFFGRQYALQNNGQSFFNNNPDYLVEVAARAHRTPTGTPSKPGPAPRGAASEWPSSTPGWQWTMRTFQVRWLRGPTSPTSRS
ncbi:hypothetical protein QK290_15095 [Pseudarthrobacter sp. AL07]|uniref:S8 family serine peptidase n=1 Tax=unclassified Pseudarthrobacter TaxID=2647000 RepID=UPI00249BB274|nr:MULTISPECIES: hypothetical protein [unclassified Pseudarthrobacter]MDI3195658.1 hypothetical protein [Pseudarthrobacter sp. AL20]MDI3209793.1 hypothetical protein [Pseudarthrobacter sp. AL07]